jgi:hypothetical protein
MRGIQEEPIESGTGRKFSYICKQVSMLHKNNEMKKLKYEMLRNEVNINNSVKELIVSVCKS